MAGVTGRADPGRAAAIRHMKAAYTSKGINQGEFAEQSGVPTRTLQRLEAGEGWASPNTLWKIEKALGWGRGYMDEYAARYNEDAARQARGPSAVRLKQARELLERALDTLGEDFPGSAGRNG